MPRPGVPWILHKLSTNPTIPAGPTGIWIVLLRAPNIPMNVHAEYIARRMLCAMTQYAKVFVLLISHGLLSLNLLYLFIAFTVGVEQ